MFYGYYPGCSLHGTAEEFDISIKASFRNLQIGLNEVPDWNCCGASSAHSTSEELDLALVARILAQAEKAKMQNVLVPCAACFSRLKMTNMELSGNAELQARVKSLIGQEYKGTVKISHILEVYRDLKDKITASAVKSFSGLKVACYYGCLLARPAEVVDFDDTENPMVMDELVTALGAEALDWSHKTECCGAGFIFSRGDISKKLVGDILDGAQDAGADLIAVACPLCHANLDMNQSAAGKVRGKKYDLPVIYISQMIGLAQGEDARSLGLNKHLVNADKIIRRLKAAESMAAENTVTETAAAETVATVTEPE
jgi:heterodisulfide reductase subunit B